MIDVVSTWQVRTSPTAAPQPGISNQLFAPDVDAWNAIVADPVAFTIRPVRVTVPRTGPTTGSSTTPAEFWTVVMTEVEVRVFEWASVATARRSYSPSVNGVVSQLQEYGALLSVQIVVQVLEPWAARWIWTLAIEVSPSEAVALTDTVPVTAYPGSTMLTFGAVQSGAEKMFSGVTLVSVNVAPEAWTPENAPAPRSSALNR